MEKFAFLFPGQGAQFIKMGEYFYNSYLISRQTYEEASAVLGYNVANLCFCGKYSEINDFVNMQIALVTTEMAIYRAYKQDIGIEPQFFIGHSIGEYAALAASGAVEFKDVLIMLKKRGELVKSIIDNESGHMTIVEYVDMHVITNLIQEFGLESEVFISCLNTKEQFALSGTISGLDCIEKALVEIGAVISPLISAPPMHSPLMESIREEYLIFLKTIHYFPFRIPIIANVTGKVFSDSKQIPELMADHLVKPVRFSNSIELLYDYGVSVCIEMGAKRLISDFIGNKNGEISTFCYGVKAHREELKKLIDSDEHFIFDMPDFIGNCLTILASTENKNTNNEEFLTVQLLYKKLKKIYQNKSIENDCYKDILYEVIEALRIKKLEENEIKSWIKMLLDNTNTFYKYSCIYEQIGR